MPLHRRRPPLPPLPLEQPRLDGGGWPPAPARAGFEVQTAWELAQRRAVEPDAHGVGERVVDAVLPVLRLDVPAQDRPHLYKTLVTAARLGAGVALLRGGEPGRLDRTAAGVLWLARRSLPATPGDLGSFLLLAGHWTARTDVTPHATAVAALVVDAERHRTPG